MIEQGELRAEQATMPRQPRILAASFALLAAVLLTLLVLLVGQANRARDAAQARKQHSYDVIVLTGQLEGAIARAEAALGRYVIAKDPRDGTIYYDEWRNAANALGLLAGIAHDDPGEAAHVGQFQQLFAARTHELGEAANLIPYKRQWNALSMFARAGRSPVLPEMSRLLREIVAAERATLDMRTNAADDTVHLSNLYVRLLSLVGILLTLSAVAAGWLAMTSIHEGRRARDAADAELDRTAALERAVAERTLALSDANVRLRQEAREREDAEARLRQVQKLDAIGQLTGGIAHDFNNMLAVVIGGLELARRRVDEQAAEAGRHIDNAMDGATRAAALTRRLLSFARAEPLLPAAADPTILLEGMSDLIDRTIGERIAVTLSIGDALWPIWIDQLALENAVLNLCVNARDAMEGAGTLAIEAANVSLAAGEIGALGAGDYVRIAVRDRGAGMSAETLERVFEPFFTTKPVGQGTGLGLSQIFGFARQSGGDVAIDSVLGMGTTVAIYLPRHDGVASPMSADGEAAMPARGEGTILVVEDDPRVRQSTGEALRELGYQPLLAASADAALALIAARDDIALLLTDVVMPDVTGPDLVRRVHRTRPDLPVLFVTGYVGEAGDAERFGSGAVLRKPFTMHALATHVAKAIG